MLVGADFLYIQGSAAWYVCFKDGIAVFIDANRFDQPVCRDGGSIGGSQFLCGEQAEGDVFPFLVHADGEGFVLLQQLLERNFYLLALVDKTNACGGNLHFLPGIGQGNLFGFWINYHAIRRGSLQNLIAAQIQGFRGGGPVAPCGEGSGQFTGFQVDGAIRGDDIFQRGDIVNSARLALHLVLRLVQPACFCHVAEYFALFGNGDGAFLRDIVFLNRDNVLRSVHHKGNRLPVKHISPRALLFHQFVISKAQGFRQHEGACGVCHEGVDVDGAGVIDMLHHPFAGIGIADFDSSSRKRNNFSTFQILFLKPDEGGKGRVIEDIIVGLAMLGNEHGEVGDKFLPLGPCGLMHHVQTVWEVLRTGKTIGIGD